MGDYRKLRVWQRARDISARIVAAVAELPGDQRLRIGDQMIRAIDSVRFNIAEGCGLNSDRQLARHLLIALGSANEVQDQLDALAESDVLPKQFLDLSPQVGELRAMLAVLQRRVSEPKPRTSSKR